MREVYENREEARRRGLVAAQEMAERWTWRNAARRIAEAALERYEPHKYTETVAGRSAAKMRALLWGADKAVRVLFQTFANVAGSTKRLAENSTAQAPLGCHTVLNSRNAAIHSGRGGLIRVRSHLPLRVVEGAATPASASDSNPLLETVLAGEVVVAPGAPLPETDIGPAHMLRFVTAPNETYDLVPR